MKQYNSNTPYISTAGALLVVVIAALLLAGGLYGCPKYKVYRQDMQGQASLAEAQHNRKIAVAEARAAEESAHYKAREDSIRAEGVAKANKIIAESITPEYLRWLWVKHLGDPSSKVVYVPTEANLPIMEAGRTIK